MDAAVSCHVVADAVTVVDAVVMLHVAIMLHIAAMLRADAIMHATSVMNDLVAIASVIDAVLMSAVLTKLTATLTTALAWHTRCASTTDASAVVIPMYASNPPPAGLRACRSHNC